MRDPRGHTSILCADIYCRFGELGRVIVAAVDLLGSVAQLLGIVLEPERLRVRSRRAEACDGNDLPVRHARTLRLRVVSDLFRADALWLGSQQATCVGDRLEANLSLGQVQQLGRAARAYGKDDKTPGRLTAEDLVRVAG